MQTWSQLHLRPPKKREEENESRSSKLRAGDYSLYAQQYSFPLSSDVAFRNAGLLCVNDSTMGIRNS